MRRHEKEKKRTVTNRKRTGIEKRGIDTLRISYACTGMEMRTLAKSEQ